MVDRGAPHGGRDLVGTERTARLAQGVEDVEGPIEPTGSPVDGLLHALVHPLSPMLDPALISA